MPSLRADPGNRQVAIRRAPNSGECLRGSCATSLLRRKPFGVLGVRSRIHCGPRACQQRLAWIGRDGFTVLHVHQSAGESRRTPSCVSRTSFHLNFGHGSHTATRKSVRIPTVRWTARRHQRPQARITQAASVRGVWFESTSRRIAFAAPLRPANPCRREPERRSLMTSRRSDSFQGRHASFGLGRPDQRCPGSKRGGRSCRPAGTRQ